jgi:hypothetical protein
MIEGGPGAYRDRFFMGKTLVKRKETRQRRSS